METTSTRFEFMVTGPPTTKIIVSHDKFPSSLVCDDSSEKIDNDPKYVELLSSTINQFVCGRDDQFEEHLSQKCAACGQPRAGFSLVPEVYLEVKDPHVLVTVAPHCGKDGCAMAAAEISIARRAAERAKLGLPSKVKKICATMVEE